jgi:hypothetical protein
VKSILPTVAASDVVLALPPQAALRQTCGCRVVGLNLAKPEISAK